MLRFQAAIAILSGLCANKSTEMHLDGDKAANGSRRPVMPRVDMWGPQPAHAVGDHGGGVPAHRRLQFTHVDKDTILTLEHAERLVNSVAVRGMDSRVDRESENRRFVSNGVDGCRAAWAFPTSSSTGGAGAKLRRENPRIHAGTVLAGATEHNQDRGNASKSRNGS